MKVIIVEDEAPALRRIKRLLEDLDSSIEVIATADSIDSACSCFLKFPETDLAILDIELADGKSFEIFNRIEVKCPVIFTTAYDEYAIQAFKLNSIDYLLKPVDTEELNFAINKFKRINPTQNLQFDIKAVLDIMNVSQLKNTSYKNRFLVKSGVKLVSVECENIAFFKAADKVVTLFTRVNSQYIIDNTLEELVEQLNPKDFHQLNRQYIVNINSIKSIQSYFNGKLKIKLYPIIDDEVIVSREKSAAFRAWMGG